MNGGFRSAVRDFEVVQRNLVSKQKGLKIALNLDAYERNVDTAPLWQMQSAASSHWSNSEAMTRAWRALSGAFVDSMLVQMTQSERQWEQVSWPRSDHHRRDK